MAKNNVICTQCGQPVSKREAEIIFEDPDLMEDEYICYNCQDNTDWDDSGSYDDWKENISFDPDEIE